MSPKRQKQLNDNKIDQKMEAAAEASSSTTSPFQNMDVLKTIVSFVGTNQFRFVAAFSKDFKAIYLQLFDNNTDTYYNATTKEHINICFEDITIDHSRNSTLCSTAARHGNLSVLKYLRSLHFYWDMFTCQAAIQYGHVHILTYLQANDCPWYGFARLVAAENGHLDVLQ
jgi:hypothetical protein